MPQRILVVEALRLPSIALVQRIAIAMSYHRNSPDREIVAGDIHGLTASWRRHLPAPISPRRPFTTYGDRASRLAAHLADTGRPSTRRRSLQPTLKRSSKIILERRATSTIGSIPCGAAILQVARGRGGDRAVAHDAYQAARCRPTQPRPLEPHHANSHPTRRGTPVLPRITVLRGAGQS